MKNILSTFSTLGPYLKFLSQAAPRHVNDVAADAIKLRCYIMLGKQVLLISLSLSLSSLTEAAESLSFCHDIKCIR